MRRLFVLAGLIGAFAVSAASGALTASAAPRAHATSSAPLVIRRLKDGEVFAFARVIVHGHAFPFLIDTGSSQSLVDVALARQLHLKTVGRPIKVTGVGCSSTAHKVRLRNWSIGGQALPSIVAVSTVVAGANGQAFGLLGSDVLSRFGSFAIDYTHGVLTLG